MSTPASIPIDRTRPPKPGLPKEIRFPDYHEMTLPNGMRVLLYEKRDLPLAGVSIIVRGGSSRDDAVPGLAVMTAELVTKGTDNRDAVKIVDEIESLGGSISATATWDSVNIGVSILSRYLDRAVDVLSDVFRNPIFAEEEIERAREQQLSHLMQRHANPGSQAYDRLQTEVFGAHVYGSCPDGTETSIRSIQRSQMSDFHEQLFHVGNAFIVAAGDIEPQKFFHSIDDAFGDLQAAKTLDGGTALPARSTGRTVHVVDRPNAVQSSVLVGHVGIERGARDYLQAAVMNTLYGGYFGSRLMQKLREEKGFTYGAYSRFDARLQSGPFSAGADVRNDVTGETVSIILEELDRMVSEAPDESELDSVRNYIAGGFPLQLETPGQVAQRIIGIELYQLGKSYYDGYTGKILSISAEDIHRVARKYLDPDHATIVVSGKADDIVNQLSAFGRVNVYTPAGERIS